MLNSFAINFKNSINSSKTPTHSRSFFRAVIYLELKLDIRITANESPSYLNIKLIGNCLGEENINSIRISQEMNIFLTKEVIVVIQTAKSKHLSIYVIELTSVFVY